MAPAPPDGGLDRADEERGGRRGHQLREYLDTLAFGLVRTDETATGAKRIYLAQLAHQLELGPDTVSRLESEVASRIDTEEDAADGDD